MNTFSLKITKIIELPMNAICIKRALIFFCLITTLNCFGQDHSKIRNKFSEWLTQPELKHSSVGICMQDAKTGKTLYETSPQLSLIPGSILKLVTTATALEILGSDYIFETKLATNGELSNDTLYGDLLIIGGGDPALGSEYFKEYYLEDHFLDEWCSVIRERNIKYICGKIITDASIYEEQTVPSSWTWEDIGNYYGAGACGLSVYDNMFRIHLSSLNIAGRKTQIEKITPEIPQIKFNNQVLSSGINRDLAYVFGSPDSFERTIRGTIPKGKNDFVIKASMPDPPALLKWQFQERLSKKGIRINVNKSKYKLAEPYLLTSLNSPKLNKIIEATNHESINLFAEHLLKHLAFMENGLGSTKNGVKIIKRFWEEKGIDTNGFFMADGSGLSRFNAMTAKQMVDILSYMKNASANQDAFFSSIPTVPNGTLYVFEHEKFPNGCLQAKSGSMTRVRCYAGLLKTSSNQEILFSIMLNNFSCSQAKVIDLIEDLLLTVYREH